MWDFIDDILSVAGDAADFIKTILWDIPNLIIREILPNLPYNISIIVTSLLLTILVVGFLKIKNLVL